MILENDATILFIEPQMARSQNPMIDDLTICMFNAFKNHSTTGVITNTGQFLQGWCTKGVHECICGKQSKPCDYLLESGQVTNSLCVHYLAYHRAEVPETDIVKVRALKTKSTLDSADWKYFNETL